MEKRPLGLTEAMYASRRSEAFKKMDPKQKAIFAIWENLWDLENQENSPHKITWNNSLTTESIIEDALDGYIPALPLPSAGMSGYKSFHWDITNTQTQTLESFALRIYVGAGTIDIRSLVGNLSALGDIWPGITEDIPFPIRVKDSHGFNFENKALKAKQKS